MQCLYAVFVVPAVNARPTAQSNAKIKSDHRRVWSREFKKRIALVIIILVVFKMANKPPVVTVYPTSSIDNAKDLEMGSQETNQHKQDVRIHILIIILHKYSS